MTEQEWLNSTDPAPMLEFLRGKSSDRKLRLLLCAALRYTTGGNGCNDFEVVDLIEEFADGTVGRESIAAMLAERVQDDEEDFDPNFARNICEPNLELPLRYFRYGLPVVKWFACYLCQEFLGNPFHPATANPTWLSPTVVALSEAIYAERAFDRLPILADALEEAGCDNADILNHCRGEGPHVRGCWVVDLLLGKS